MSNLSLEVEEALGELEDDADWRRQEISYLRTQENLTRFGSEPRAVHRNRIYLRLLIAALYAHHEGFAIKCWETIYLAFDKADWLPLQLRPELQLLLLDRPLRALRQLPSADILEALHNVGRLFPANYSFVIEKPIKSDGNLNPKSYCRAFGLLGIDIPMDAREEQLLYQLVSYRNDVVHGRHLNRRAISARLDDFVKIVYSLQDRAFLKTREYIERSQFMAPV